MNNEFRVFGTPGAGKTSRLATRDIPRAVEKYGKDGVMVTSYTRAAAEEITFKRSRETGMRIDVNEKNVGTIHSILYHALDQPEITEVHYTGEWNKKFPQYQISGKAANILDEISSGESHRSQAGDNLLSAVNIHRNRLIPLKSWKSDQIKFYEHWNQFKKDTHSIDFTDLIEAGYYEFESAPNDPNVIFVDEAQDFTKLQLSTIRKWSKKTDWVILTGDDDQTIFSFVGAHPDSLIDPPLDEKFKTVLKRSYRVPQTVLDRAQRIIVKLSKREPKIHLPRLEDNGDVAVGEVREVNMTYQNPGPLIDCAQEYVDKGMSVMFLASCSYMLEPVKAEFRRRALPFHNPYRRRRRDWNPLFQHGTLNDFLEQGPDEEYWTVPQFISWAQHVKVGPEGLVRKMGRKGIERLKIAIDDMEDGLHTSREVLPMLLEPSAVKAALARDVDWLLKNVKAEKQRSLEYPSMVYKEHGKKGIEDEPKHGVGTIHSVKGATFDVVILFPDISYLADLEMGHQEGRDAIYRLFYVGMTRAKHSLIICRPTCMMSKNPRMYVRL